MNRKQKIYTACALIVSLTLFSLFVGYVTRQEEIRQAADKLIPRVKTSTGNEFKIETVRGCEYIYGWYGSAQVYVFTHKGDCTNGIHIYNRKLEQ